MGKISDAHTLGLRRKFKKKLLLLRGGCEVCGESEWGKLELHHKVYRWTLEIDDLSLLCREHHQLLHKFVKASDRDLPRFTDVFISGYRDSLA